jgi:hypothetical protein
VVQVEGARFYFKYRTRVCGDSAAYAARACRTLHLFTSATPSRALGEKLDQELRQLYEEQVAIEKLGFDRFDAAASVARQGGDRDLALAALVTYGPAPLGRKDPESAAHDAAGAAAAGAGSGDAAAAAAAFPGGVAHPQQPQPQQRQQQQQQEQQHQPPTRPSTQAESVYSVQASFVQPPTPPPPPPPPPGSQLVRDLTAMGFTDAEAQAAAARHASADAAMTWLVAKRAAAEAQEAAETQDALQLAAALRASEAAPPPTQGRFRL